MALDILSLLNKTGALLQGHYRLSSGLHSPNYVQCAVLLQHPRNAKVIGESLARRIKAIKPKKIVAPALGGLIIGYVVADALQIPLVFTERKEGAMVLRRGFRISEGERIVIVEDVVTTGKSTRETAEVVAGNGGVVFGYASILNRSGKDNPFTAPFESLLSLKLETLEEKDCRLCAAGVPLDSPGSRYSAR